MSIWFWLACAEAPSDSGEPVEADCQQIPAWADGDGDGTVCDLGAHGGPEAR